jgi:hypothetical protein
MTEFVCVRVTLTISHQTTQSTVLSHVCLKADNMCGRW